MTDTQEFLNKYATIEQLVKSRYQLERGDTSPIVFLSQKAGFRDVAAEMDYCRQVRNLLDHNPTVYGEYAITPSKGILKLLDNVIRRLENPRTAMDVAVRPPHIYCCNEQDSVRTAMENMNQHAYTHVPILRNNIVCGVFSGNVLINYLVEEEALEINEETKFYDIGKYLPLQSHGSEKFCFVRRDASAGEIADFFAKRQAEGKRVGMAFVTEHGKPNEKLLGIITAWDLIDLHDSSN